MTDSEQFELIGRTRANYKERKQELAALKAKAAKAAELAATLARGLQNPELIRWWSGTHLIGQRPEHVILTAAMFTELSEQNIKQLSETINRLSTTIGAIRKQLIDLEGEDPER
jgi:hypothetical protein